VTEHPLGLSFNAYPAQTSPTAAAAAAAAVVVSTQPVEAGRALTVDEPSSGQHYCRCLLHATPHRHLPLQLLQLRSTAGLEKRGLSNFTDD